MLGNVEGQEGSMLPCGNEGAAALAQGVTPGPNWYEKWGNGGTMTGLHHLKDQSELIILYHSAVVDHSTHQ